MVKNSNPIDAPREPGHLDRDEWVESVVDHHVDDHDPLAEDGAAYIRKRWRSAITRTIADVPDAVLQEIRDPADRAWFAARSVDERYALGTVERIRETLAAGDMRDATLKRIMADAREAIALERDRAAWEAARREATEILADLAGDGHAPTLAELADWLAPPGVASPILAECPPDVTPQAEATLCELLGADGWQWMVRKADGQRVPEALPVAWNPDHMATDARAFAFVEDVDQLWNYLRGRDETDVDHPVAPLVKAWQKRPHDVRGDARPDPLLPVVRVLPETRERTAGRLAFGGIVGDREFDDPQLPLFPHQDGPRVPLLEVADVRGGPIMAAGRGAPLDLRLFVGALILKPHGSRGTRRRLVATVRELRDFLFPNGWQRGRDWPRVIEALRKANDYAIPGPFKWGGRTVGDWLPFRLVGGATMDAGLDNVVLIDVEYPPGSADGPPIAGPELWQLGVQSAPRFRAYIAAHSVAWSPGVTRVPHPRNRRFRVWSGDVSKYPVLTAEDRDRLAYGATSAMIGHRSRAEKDAQWERLPGSEILTRKATTQDGRRGWVIVPAAAADAIRKKRGE